LDYVSLMTLRLGSNISDERNDKRI